LENAVMEDAVEEFRLTGFDPLGEPHVRRTAAGRLWLCVEFMPPSWSHAEPGVRPEVTGLWANFDKRLAEAIGVSVVWEDREWFRIDHPREDTVQAIQRFLLAERRMGTATDSEFREELYLHLGSVFAPHGFELCRSEERFVRWTGEILQSITVGVATRLRPELRFTLDFGFRVEAAQILELVFSGESAPDPAFPCCEVALSALTSELSSERTQPGYIRVAPDRPVEAAVSWWAPVLERDVFPFLNSHRDIASIDRLMNRDERELLEDTEPYRSVFGIIFAYLARNPELPRLITKYRQEEMVAYGEEDRTGYDRLANHLLSRH
jgi:hypothetical protein